MSCKEMQHDSEQETKETQIHAKRNEPTTQYTH